MSTMDEKTKDIVLGMGNNIECLTAPDRNKRKNALKNITKTVEKVGPMCVTHARTHGC